MRLCRSYGQQCATCDALWPLCAEDDAMSRNDSMDKECDFSTGKVNDCLWVGMHLGEIVFQWFVAQVELVA